MRGVKHQNAGLAPVVDPAGDLTAVEVERYSRHIMLAEVGVIGQQRLKNVRVLVVGAGGLGAPVLLYLAAAGVGTLGIVDDDTVDLSNMQRQIIHGVGDLGRSKLASACDAVANLNPLVQVRRHGVRLDSTNVMEIFDDYDVVIDGSDNFATRYLVSDAAAILGKPCVWGSVSGFDGQVSVFWEKHGPTYRDLYPEAPPVGTAPSCGEAGVFSAVCAVVGSMIVGEVVKLTIGIGRPLLGRLAIFTALTSSWSECAVLKDPAREPVTKLVDYEAFCGLAPQHLSGFQHGVTVKELATMLADRNRGLCTFDLIDVREPAEHRLVRIPGARLIPQGRIFSGEALSELDHDREIVVYCKVGIRSAEVAAELKRRGYARVKNVYGGVSAWVGEVESFKPDY